MKWQLFRRLTKRRVETNRPIKETSKVEKAAAIQKGAHTTNATKIARKFCEAMSSRDTEAVKALVSDGCIVRFIQANDELPLDDFLEMVAAIFASFPDFELMILKVEEETAGNGDPDTRIVNITTRAKGTHTGKPFAFGPFPPVPTSGIFVQDPVSTNCSFHVRDNKIYRHEITSEGKSHEAGPAFFYTTIGGTLI